jgi:hypothetical protein
MAGISGTMAYDPSQLAGLNPGANTSGGGGSTLGPMTTGATMGGTTSPFVPAPVTGTNMPAYSSPYASSGATSALANLGGPTNANQPGGPNTNVGSGEFGFTGSDLAKSFQKAGTMPGGLGTAAAAFMNSGAGYNPAVAQALIAALQPQFAKGQANLMEQFGATGQAAGSPAALGLGDYLAQTNLDVGQLLSGLYEQSVSNYLGVLNMGHVNVSQTNQQGGGIMGALGGLLGGIAPNIGPAIGAGASGLPGWASILLGA